MSNEHLTAEQRLAVESEAPRILCVAGPGSGKTTVLAHRIQHLSDRGADRRKMVAITYTNKAAARIAEKARCFACGGQGWTEIGSLGGGSEQVPCQCSGLELGFVGTLHGFCLRMLKEHGKAFGYGARTAILDDDAALELLKSKATTIGCKLSDKKLLEIKRGGRPVGTRLSSGELAVIAYFDELRESGIVDFDLILSEFLRLLRTAPVFLDAIRAAFEFLLVDETQDLAILDWSIVDELPMLRKFFVGDPDQAIYGFRGGRQDLMLSYAMRPTTTVLHLQSNFRCGADICAAANKLIGHNIQRMDKATTAALEHDSRVTRFGQTLNEGDEIAQVAGYIKHVLAHPAELYGALQPREIAVLSRSGAIADGFREFLAQVGLPVATKPAEEFPRDWGFARSFVELLAQPDNDTLAFFHLIAEAVLRGKDPAIAREDAHAIRLAANRASRSINEMSLHLKADGSLADVGHALFVEGVCAESRAIVAEKIKTLPPGSGFAELALAMATASPGAEIEQSDGRGEITVTTIHGAKGREWDLVFLVGMEDELMPGHSKKADVEEERRIAFVGITRARKAIFFSHAATRRASWGYKPLENRTPSRFMAEATT